MQEDWKKCGQWHGQFEANYNLQIDPKALLSACKTAFSWVLLLLKKTDLSAVGGTLHYQPTTWVQQHYYCLGEKSLVEVFEIAFLEKFGLNMKFLSEFQILSNLNWVSCALQ